MGGKSAAEVGAKPAALSHEGPYRRRAAAALAAYPSAAIRLRTRRSARLSTPFHASPRCSPTTFHARFGDAGPTTFGAVSRPKSLLPLRRSDPSQSVSPTATDSCGNALSQVYNGANPWMVLAGGPR